MNGLMRLMNSDYDLPVNLGNPDEYTVKVRVCVLSTQECVCTYVTHTHCYFTHTHTHTRTHPTTTHNTRTSPCWCGSWWAGTPRGSRRSCTCPPPRTTPPSAGPTSPWPRRWVRAWDPGGCTSTVRMHMHTRINTNTHTHTYTHLPAFGPAAAAAAADPAASSACSCSLLPLRAVFALGLQVLAWEPRVPVREGLAKAVEYFRRELEETGKCLCMCVCVSLREVVCAFQHSSLG